MQTNIYGGGTSSFFQTYRWHSNSNKIPFWLWSNTKHLYFRCFFGLRFWVGIYLWVTPQNGDLDSTRNFFVFKTASQKNITAGETGFWHEKIKIPSGYKVLYVSATYNNADSCMLTSYDATITCIGNTSDIEPWFGFYATRTGTGTFTAYAVCVKI